MQQQRQLGGRAIQHVHLLLLQPLQHRLRVLAGVLRHEAQAVAVHHMEDLLHGDVEEDGRVDTEAQAFEGLARVEDLGGRGPQVQPRAVLHHDALGLAGGARGVDDVGEVVRAGGRRHIVLGKGRQRCRLEVEAHQVLHSRLPCLGQVPHGEQHGGSAVLEDEGPALRGRRRVDGHEGATGLEYGQQGDDGLRGALQAQAHAHVGADPQRAQVPGELIGAGVELVEGQRQVPEPHGWGPWRADRLLLEEGVEAGLAREAGRGAVPLHPQPLVLFGRLEFQGGQRHVWCSQGPFQQALEVCQEALRSGALEQLGAEDEPAAIAVRRARQAQAQLELGGVGVDFHAPQREAGQDQLRARRVLQDEHRLEQRRAAQVSRRLQLFHQLLERHVLVIVGAERGVTHLGQQLAEGELRGEAGAQHQGVDEDANEALRLRVAASGDGRADQHVVLARVALQEGLEGGEQHHEGGGVLALREGLDRFAEPGWQRHRHRGAQVREGRGPRLVGGQLQRVRSAGEQLLPPAELRMERLSL